MSESCTVLYNGSCPICSREIAVYRTEAEAAAPHVAFRDVTAPDAAPALTAAGLTPDDAARRFHVVQDGRVLSGLDAFVALWSALPRWRWLARLAVLPGVRTLAAALYDRVAAPLLYALHRRRLARAALAESRGRP
jgi:predicted DCC family thiol-disulfide oxidoreductase YuxK